MIYGENNDDELDFIFKNIKSNNILIWCTNSMLYNVLRCNHYDFNYKTIITWVKLTKNDKLCYGLGQSFRNCTEQLLLFTKNKVKPIRTDLRNIIQSKSQKRTCKPHEDEIKILDFLISKNEMLKSSYIFCGLDISLFNNYNIDMVDISLNTGVINGDIKCE